MSTQVVEAAAVVEGAHQVNVRDGAPRNQGPQKTCAAYAVVTKVAQILMRKYNIVLNEEATTTILAHEADFEAAATADVIARLCKNKRLMTLDRDAYLKLEIDHDDMVSDFDALFEHAEACQGDAAQAIVVIDASRVPDQKEHERHAVAAMAAAVLPDGTRAVQSLNSWGADTPFFDVVSEADFKTNLKLERAPYLQHLMIKDVRIVRMDRHTLPAGNPKRHRLPEVLARHAAQPALPKVRAELHVAQVKINRIVKTEEVAAQAKADSEARLAAHRQAAQLQYGFRVDSTNVRAQRSFSAVYERSGEREGFPVYKSDDGQGLYYHAGTKRWHVLSAYTDGLAERHAASAYVQADDSVLPLGKTVWKRWQGDDEWDWPPSRGFAGGRAAGWQDCAVTIAPVDAADLLTVQNELAQLKGAMAVKEEEATQRAEDTKKALADSAKAKDQLANKQKEMDTGSLQLAAYKQAATLLSGVHIEVNLLANDKLQPGSVVTVRGLEREPQHNGKPGTVKEFDSEKGRFVVNMSDLCVGLLSIKPENLAVDSFQAIYKHAGDKDGFPVYKSSDGQGLSYRKEIHFLWFHTSEGPRRAYISAKDSLLPLGRKMWKSSRGSIGWQEDCAVTITAVTAADLLTVQNELAQLKDAVAAKEEQAVQQAQDSKRALKEAVAAAGKAKEDELVGKLADKQKELDRTKHAAKDFMAHKLQLIRAHTQAAEKLSCGVQISGCPVAALNAVYERRGEFNDFPLYVAASDACDVLPERSPALYFHTQTKKWMVLQRFSHGSAEAGSSTLKIAAKDGSVPLGEQTWSCYVEGTWQDCSINVTAATSKADRELAQLKGQLERVQQGHVADTTRLEHDAAAAQVELQQLQKTVHELVNCRDAREELIQSRQDENERLSQKLLCETSQTEQKPKSEHSTKVMNPMLELDEPPPPQMPDSSDSDEEQDDDAETVALEHARLALESELAARYRSECEQAQRQHELQRKLGRMEAELQAAKLRATEQDELLLVAQAAAASRAPRTDA